MDRVQKLRQLLANQPGMSYSVRGKCYVGPHADLYNRLASTHKTVEAVLASGSDPATA